MRYILIYVKDGDWELANKIWNELRDEIKGKWRPIWETIELFRHRLEQRGIKYYYIEWAISSADDQTIGRLQKLSDMYANIALSEAKRLIEFIIPNMEYDPDPQTFSFWTIIPIIPSVVSFITSIIRKFVRK